MSRYDLKLYFMYKPYFSLFKSRVINFYPHRDNLLSVDDIQNLIQINREYIKISLYFLTKYAR